MTERENQNYESISGTMTNIFELSEKQHADLFQRMRTLAEVRQRELGVSNTAMSHGHRVLDTYLGMVQDIAFIADAGKRRDKQRQLELELEVTLDAARWCRQQMDGVGDE